MERLTGPPKVTLPVSGSLEFRIRKGNKLLNITLCLPYEHTHERKIILIASFQRRMFKVDNEFTENPNL